MHCCSGLSGTQHGACNAIKHTKAAQHHINEHGGTYRGALCELGETVLAKIPDEAVTGRQLGKFADRWKRGVWLGKTDSSDEHLVSVDGQVERYRTERRLVDGRWSAQELKALRATPRMPKPGQEEEGDKAEAGRLMGSPAPPGAAAVGARYAKQPGPKNNCDF